MGLLDKKASNKERENRKKYISAFCEYFTDYYAKNSFINRISYREMSEFQGYSAIIDYKGFRQYVNIYWSTYSSCTINSCFELESRGNKFLCHFVDILNEIDSDDISFYTFTHCAEYEKMRFALDSLMQATNNYYNEICDIAASQERMDSVFNELYFEDIDVENEFISTVPEDAADLLYFTYEMLYERNELKKTLTKAARKNKLDNKYEKRACRVLKNQSRNEIKQYEKLMEKKRKYPLKDVIIMSAPSVIIALLFGAVFCVLGIQIDKHLYPDYIGKNYLGTGTVFFFLGMIISMFPISLISDKFYKLFVPENHYSEFLLMLESERMNTLEKIIVAVIMVIGFCIMFVFLAFTGVFFTSDGNIIEKDFAFQKAESYSFSEIEVAVIDDIDGDGVFQYTEKGYAFKIDGVWIDYGVPDDDAGKIIENGIVKNNKQVKVYEYFEDIYK